MDRTQPLTLLSIKDRNIEDCIYNVRDQQVMIDSDVAFFFGTEIKKLNQQMKRNKDRFPEDFCFQLNSKEFKTLRSQNVTIENENGNRKYLPYVYTEHGVLALAGVIKNEVAAKMSVEIVRKFVQMRKFIMENGDVLLALAKLQNRQIEFENETNKKFDEILKLISKADLPKQAIFAAGQFYDAYEFISSIIRRANHSIVLFDPYCDSRALSFLKNKKEAVELTICSSHSSKLRKEEIDRFESQYGKIRIKHLDDNHDRYLIVDKEECYQLGASLNYAGKKMFGVIKIENKEIIDLLLKRLGL